MQPILEIPIDYDKLLYALQLAKMNKTEYSVIPRLLCGDYRIYGESFDSIATLSRNPEMDIVNFMELWSDETYLESIIFMTKDINLFIRLMQDNKIKECYLGYRQYVVNGKNVGIGVYITAKQQVEYKSAQGTVKCIPNIQLTPYGYNIENRVRDIITLFDNCKFKSPVYEIDDDEDFLNIQDMKAADGARLWVPNPDKYPEIRNELVYLSKVIFPVAKRDKVYVNIANNIPGYNSRYFMANFTVKKKSKHRILSYYIIGAYLN